MQEIFTDLINFSDEEKKVTEFWNKIQAFQTSLKQSKHKKKYSFYDGPPFATGLPHYGHLLTSSLKDIITRYAHQTNHHVDRRFGWDCHGLPVEYEIDKKLNIQGPADVLKMGIAAYNRECRSIVMKYSKEWESVVNRIGRWVDFERDYKTMYPSFMESVWFIFKQIFEKGLVYRGMKVMPFSTACSTPLSNFESKQNYKDTTDPTVVVSFPLVDEPNIAMLAWTTTPWTLPSNLALCVHPDMEYVKVLEKKSGNLFILMESRINYVFGKSPVDIVDRFKGNTLEGHQYVPLFNYFINLREQTGAFRVVCDSYVTEGSGTGIVHQAPYFGEDDFRVCMGYGIIKKTGPVVCPIDECGKFTEPITEFVGRYVKDADPLIIAHLKQNKRLYSSGSEVHSYPFCWRSDTPLINKAVPSWFIRVEDIIDQMLAANAATYWVPEFVKENRFTNWLKDARDWAISRNRFWGTPLPIWVSDDFEEIVCVGSVAELEQLSGVRVTDLHRDSIDDIIIPSRQNKGVLHRIPEVFDCWFESGAMPFAQLHFPFSTSLRELHDVFPADFIAEGIDQTRGWFYTLTVISTILFGCSPFKNLVVNGIVLASNGQKMSKRLKNYPDPVELLEKYGADAIRMYMVSSPVVRGQNLRFEEKGVHDVIKDVFIPWYNSFKFLFQSALLPYEKAVNGGKPHMFEPGRAPRTTNMMDSWIMSFTQSLIRFFSAQMGQYRLDTVVPQLIRYVDQLTNWYVRMNRKRLRGEIVTSPEDWLTSINTLFFVLYQATVMISPFAPYITEFFYQKLKLRLEFPAGSHDLTIGVGERNCPDSVHYIMIPQCDETLIRPEFEESVALMQTVVELGRKIRIQKLLALKTPLSEVVVVSQTLPQIEKILSVESYVLEELNVKKLTISTDKVKYNVELKAELNHRVLGAKLNKDYKNVLKASKTLTTAQLEAFQASGTINICGHDLGVDDIEVVATVNNDPKLRNGDHQYESLSSPEGVLVLMDCHQSEALIQEGVAREIINFCQRRRKELKLVPEDPVMIRCWSDCASTREVFESHAELINRVILQPIMVTPITKEAVGVCSLLSDITGAQPVPRLKSGAELHIQFSHDHARMTPANRQCEAVVDSLEVATDEADIAPTTVSVDVDRISNWDQLKRMVRISLGWTKFGVRQIELYDQANQKLAPCDPRTLKGSKLFARSA